MSALALPAISCLFAWWFGTGAILFLDRRPRWTFAWSMGGATVLAGAAVAGLLTSRADASAGGAYVAFGCGLVVWAWLEMSFYMGFVTGPRREVCAPACHGMAHFGHAVMSCLYHELATLVVAALLLWGLRGQPNPLGLWTFLMLWGMQVSAKLNVFLGVPNVSEAFLPEHLAFLKGFLTRKPMNALFPISITASVAITTILAQKTLAAPAGGFEATAFGILTTLAALALLEHWFLVLPIKAEALWSWSLGSPRTGVTASTASTTGAASSHASCPPHRHAMGSTRFGQAWFGRLLTRGHGAGTLTVSPHPQPVQPSLIRRPR